MNTIEPLLASLQAIKASPIRVVVVEGYVSSKGDKSDYTVEIGESYNRIKNIDRMFLESYKVSESDVIEFKGHVGSLEQIPEANLFLTAVKAVIEGQIEDPDIESNPSFEIFRRHLLSGGDIQTVLAAWLLQQACKDLHKSATDPDSRSKNQSKAQIDTYQHLAEGLKFHRQTGEIYLHGSLIVKDLKEKSKKADTRRPLTKAKDFLRKKYLKTAKWRQFKLADAKSVSLSNETLRITM
jgi:hypothetical protein